MALQIKSSPSTPESVDRIVDEMKSSIAGAVPDGEIDVTAVSPGHFEIAVTSPVFADKSRVQQQQLVYAAIAHLMKGDAAPVHAIDRLVTRVP